MKEGIECIGTGWTPNVSVSDWEGYTTIYLQVTLNESTFRMEEAALGYARRPS